MITLIGSGGLIALISSIITSTFAFKSGERKIEIENITEQRKQWREKIRELSLHIKDAYESDSNDKLEKLYVELKLSLNPTDNNDHEILKTLWNLIYSTESKSYKRDVYFTLIDQISLLLKHDWERAKSEAKPSFFTFTKRPKWRKKMLGLSPFKYFLVSRTPYKDFKSEREEAKPLNPNK